MNAQQIMIDRQAELLAIKTAMVTDGAMTVQEAADFAKVSKSMVYAMMESGKLAYVRMGRRRVIPRKALIELMAQNTVVR